MTAFKAGDWVKAQISSVGAFGHLGFGSPLFSTETTLHPSFFQPLNPDPARTAAERAVVEAAKAWREKAPKAADAFIDPLAKIAHAADALLALDAPPDPMDVLEKAVKDAQAAAGRLRITELHFSRSERTQNEREAERNFHAAQADLEYAENALRAAFAAVRERIKP